MKKFFHRKPHWLLFRRHALDGRGVGALGGDHRNLGRIFTREPLASTPSAAPVALRGCVGKKAPESELSVITLYGNHAAR
ncbi:MAG: hypothetical protein ACREX4_10615 [Gammaproteobacteria bacterium]